MKTVIVTIVGLCMLLNQYPCLADSSSTTPAHTETTVTTTEPSKPTTSPTTTAAPTEKTTVTTAPTSTSTPSSTSTLEPKPTPAHDKEVFPVTEKPSLPKASNFNVTVKDSDKTCLKAQFAAQFVLTDKNNKTVYLNLENVDKVDGSCDEVDQRNISVTLNFGVHQSVRFDFESSDNFTLSYLKAIHLKYSYENETTEAHHFDVGEQYFFLSNGTEHSGTRYTCNSVTETPEDRKKQKVIFKDVSIEMGDSKDVGNYTCLADDDVNDMIPIAVGAALLALVAIVLVAYFVGRRRSRRLAYQSV